MKLWECSFTAKRKDGQYAGYIQRVRAETKDGARAELHVIFDNIIHFECKEVK